MPHAAPTATCLAALLLHAPDIALLAWLWLARMGVQLQSNEMLGPHTPPAQAASGSSGFCETHASRSSGSCTPSVRSPPAMEAYIGSLRSIRSTS